MNNDFLWLKIETNNYYKLFRKLNEIGVDIYDSRIHGQFIIIKTSNDNYKKIKKYLFSYKYYVYNYVGLKKYLKKFNKYRVFIISSIIAFILLVVLNNIIVKIDIVSSNNEIKILLKEELEKNGIKKVGFKKSHSKIEEVVNKILDDNKDTLEWIEIKYDGLIMIVNVTPKTKNKVEEKYNYCNLVATQDAKIISMNVNRGVPLKKINDYVSKGDVIISGSIIHNEEIKNTVCANGDVFGEVWYKVNIKLPLEEEKKNYTGKKRYNLKIKTTSGDYEIFKSRILNKDEETINLYKLNDFEINIIKEKEYTKVIEELTENEAYNKAISMGIEKIKNNLDKNEEVIMQKVLKKDVNNSTIYLEIFVVTKESIITTDVIEEEY